MRRTCEECGEAIDQAKLRRSPEQRFCDQECFKAFCRRTGHYKKMSAAGNAAQIRFKQQTGYVPQYEKRKEAVTHSNSTHPRRQRRLTCHNPTCHNRIQPPRKYCSRTCDVAHRVARGDYKRMSEAGATNRSKIIAQSNREKPRRRKAGVQA